jgi:phosphatidylserine/phosphatidylglycerophosphate/cardiolipin synthase-like enzyme
VDQLALLPAHVRGRMAAALANGSLAPPYSESAVRSAIGVVSGVNDVHAQLQSLDAEGARPSLIARWLNSLTDIEQRAPRTDLVWSGSEVPGLHARDTRAVFSELFARSTKAILVSSFTYFDGPKAFGELAVQMDSKPDLDVRLVLNIQRKFGDVTKADSLVRSFTDSLWKGWPGKRRPAVFYDPRSLDLDSPAVLHAKTVVIDRSIVLVTSANLTEKAFDDNIELGLLSYDATLAASVATHFDVLIERGLLKPLPPA